MRETRAVRSEIRAVGDSLHGSIPYRSWSENLGGWRERIRPGASRYRGDLVLLWSHDEGKPLARMPQTLQLEDGKDALRWRAKLGNSTWARDALDSVARGDVVGCSFGFQTHAHEWGRGEDGLDWRELVDVELFEISPCAHPAYKQTMAAVRSAGRPGGYPPMNDDSSNYNLGNVLDAQSRIRALFGSYERLKDQGGADNEITRLQRRIDSAAADLSTRTGLR